MEPRTQNGSAGSRDDDTTYQQVITMLADSLAGALEPEMAMAVQGHLRDCDACVAFLHTYTGTMHAIHTLRFEDISAVLQHRVHRWLREMLGGQGTTEQGADSVREGFSVPAWHTHACTPCRPDRTPRDRWCSTACIFFPPPASH
jgi:hypothetical protein